MSGGDAPGGNTRSHPEHDGEDPGGRWYYAGDGMGEQAAAGLIQKISSFVIRLLRCPPLLDTGTSILTDPSSEA